MAAGQNTDTRGNASIADATGFASDTYLAGSAVAIGRAPTAGRATYRCSFDMTKTAAGTATPIIIVRFGTAGTTSDTARLTFTFAAGTAAVDSGVFEVVANFRVVGSVATMAGYCECRHALAATGLVSTGAAGNGIVFATASAFDATVAASSIGVSFNGGTSFAGTNTIVQSQWDNY